jgi:hypothetical protein
LEGFLRWYLLLIQIGGCGQFGDQTLDLRLHATVQSIGEQKIDLIVVIGEKTNVTIDDQRLAERRFIQSQRMINIHPHLQRFLNLFQIDQRMIDRFQQTIRRALIEQSEKDVDQSGKKHFRRS